MEIEDGKVVKTWINSDIISAMIQLGLLQDFMSSQFERTVARTSLGKNHKFSHRPTCFAPMYNTFSPLTTLASIKDKTSNQDRVPIEDTRRWFT